MNHNGDVIVISSVNGKILHLKMGATYDDNTRSSVAIAGNELFIRTNKVLGLASIGDLFTFFISLHHPALGGSRQSTAGAFCLDLNLHFPSN